MECGLQMARVKSHLRPESSLPDFPEGRGWMGGGLEVEIELVRSRDKGIANRDFVTGVLGSFGFICFETGWLAL